MDKQLFTFKDIPLSNYEDDLLGSKKYSQGLATYIKCCDTPMTIALQGDWGSGKTSMMNMIKSYINADKDGSIYTIWFNTWQFSQFNSDDELATIFLSYFVNKIKELQKTPDDLHGIKASKLLQKINFLKISAALGTALEIAAPSTLSEITKTFLSAYNDNNDNDDTSNKKYEMSVSTVINTLKDELQEWINEKLFRQEDQSHGRIVIFVDDLDRLEPLRAVELLEILKLFMDLENCVYVLAIDYDVVVRGVESKYGRGFSEEKGRAFFEKIIQLPFKMPVSSYDIDYYTDTLLKSMGVESENSEMLSRFFKNTIGTNPRTMKRLFNAFSLLRIIGADNNQNGKRDIILLGLLCLQTSTEKLYNLILALRYDLEADTLQTLADGSYEDLYGNDAYRDFFEDCEIEENFWNENKNLLGNLHNLISSENKNKLSEEELATFRAVLDVSTITSSGNTQKEARHMPGVGKGARRQDTGYQSEPQELNAAIKIKDIKNFNDGIGLDKCIFIDFHFDSDKENTSVKNGNDLIQKILTRIYQMEPEKFDTLRKNTTARGLVSFFYGTGTPPTFASKGTIQNSKGNDIVIELKSGAGRKIELINQIMIALQMDPSILKYRAQLKQYIN